ncbi:MAG: signal peptidase I [Firmicutes bacterium]|nr:signal peptidase I [Bacillota bacterium]
MTEAPSLPPAPETGIAPAQKHDGSGAAFATAGYPRAGAKKKSGAKSTFWSYVIEILAVLALAILLRMFVMEITQVQGPSMQPTLSTGDRLITNKLAYTFGEPQRGDIVVLKAPDVENQYYIKRIIGLPDERLSINDGQVYINGEPLAEPYLTQLLTDGNIDVVIPEGYYFVMGDNREDSRDSRMDSIGLIAEDALSGKAEFRIFPGSKIGSIYH